MTGSSRVSCTARTLRQGGDRPFEPSALTIKPWRGDTPGILLQRGRRQYRFTLEEAYDLVNAITDTAEALETEQGLP